MQLVILSSAKRARLILSGHAGLMQSATFWSDPDVKTRHFESAAGTIGSVVMAVDRLVVISRHNPYSDILEGGGTFLYNQLHAYCRGDNGM
jgi:hypothetical protein